MSRLLVAIPVYNERSTVLEVVAQVRRYLPHVLVVDDGSTDGTTELIRNLAGVDAVFHPENRGYGQALISAFDFADRQGYDWLITMDCDEQHEPSFLPAFVDAALADNADIISGSRYLREFTDNDHPPDDRQRINSLINRLLAELLGLELSDSFCGFKAYRTSSLSRLALDIPGYAFPLQFWVQAVHQGLRIREIAVPLIYNDPTRHFGGMLDDPDRRLAHYLEVLINELVTTRLSAAREQLNHCGSPVNPR